jgi:hypothetical protein
MRLLHGVAQKIAKGIARNLIRRLPHRAIFGSAVCTHSDTAFGSKRARGLERPLQQGLRHGRLPSMGTFANLGSGPSLVDAVRR